MSERNKQGFRSAEPGRVWRLERMGEGERERDGWNNRVPYTKQPLRNFIQSPAPDRRVSTGNRPNNTLELHL
jgi:hypothetical protein